MFRHLTLAITLAASAALPALAQDSDSQNKSFDVRSSVGDLHVGSDADAGKVGLPAYPGARLKKDNHDHDKDNDGDDNNDQANLSIFTEAFGFKLVVANYESDDAPAKIVDFYRDKMKKYGKVLECHTHKHGVEAHDGKDSESKELKCEESDGPGTELKVGTEDDQHVVAVEPHDSGKGATIALVYVKTRGKKGEI